MSMKNARYQTMVLCEEISINQMLIIKDEYKWKLNKLNIS